MSFKSRTIYEDLYKKANEENLNYRKDLEEFSIVFKESNIGIE